MANKDVRKRNRTPPAGGSNARYGAPELREGPTAYQSPEGRGPNYDPTIAGPPAEDRRTGRPYRPAEDERRAAFRQAAELGMPGARESQIGRPAKTEKPKRKG